MLSALPLLVSASGICTEKLVEIQPDLIVSLCLYCSSPSESSSLPDEHSDKRAHLRRDHPGCHEHLLLHLLPHTPQRKEHSSQQPVWSPQPSLQLNQTHCRHSSTTDSAKQETKPM